MAHHQTIRKQLPATRAAGSADIPDKLYFRIGEVARLCDVPAYVLRFWESEFPQLKPNKGGTGQRLFRRRDVEMALRIKRLLYDEGYTIPGARQLLKVEAKQKEQQLTLLGDDSLRSEDREARLLSLRQDLDSLLALLQAAPQPSTERAAPGLRPATRQAGANVAARRASPSPVTASENLFDFPGSSAARTDPQEIQDDPL